MASIKPTVALFLDIDGVIYDDNLKPPILNGKMAELLSPVPDRDTLPTAYHHVHQKAKTHFFSPDALKHLHDLISKIKEVAELKIVLSSSWRLTVDLTRDFQLQNVETLKEVFALHSFSQDIVDRTPYFPSHSRASEIEVWLRDHPEISNFIILDDVDLDFSKRYSDRFIYVNPNRLLNDTHVQKALSILFPSQEEIKK